MTQRTVLVVDDNRLNRELYAELLDLADCLALEAADGDTALETATQSLPDLILLDLTLPGRSGFSVADNLRRLPATAHIPILAVTAVQRESLVAELKAAGFSGLVTKPCGVTAFLDAVAWGLAPTPGVFRTFI